MQIHSLELDDEYTLIGIHTSEEDYKLAYLLNLNLNTSFSKFKYQLDFKNNKASFSIFEFIDRKKQLDVYLISNKFIENSSDDLGSSLFSNNVFYSTTSYLIPEKKNIDYFLKIEGDISNNELEETIIKLNTIHQIITSYSVNPAHLKSRDFLIF